MKVLWIILFALVYEYASIVAFQWIHKNRTRVNMLQIKYPILTSHLPFSHKFYFIILYGIFFYLAFLND